jgi:wobble nucleotide-excising tRNase
MKDKDGNMKALLHGVKKLLVSSKGTLSLIILSIATIALFYGKLPGAYYAAVVGSISTIFCYTQHRTDIASFQAGAIQNGTATSSSVSFAQNNNQQTNIQQTGVQSSVGPINTNMRGK